MRRTNVDVADVDVRGLRHQERHGRAQRSVAAVAGGDGQQEDKRRPPSRSTRRAPSHEPPPTHRAVPGAARSLAYRSGGAMPPTRNGQGAAGQGGRTVVNEVVPATATVSRNGVAPVTMSGTSTSPRCTG